MSDYTKYRILEMLPGAMVWSTFIFAIAVSFWKPLWVMVFIIVYDLYWLVRLLYLEIYLVMGYVRYRRAVRVDWQERVWRRQEANNLYHMILYPTYKEPYEVLHTSLEALSRSRYPYIKDRFIVVLAGEESDKDNFLSIAQKLQTKFGNLFYAFIITVHPQALPGELPGKGSNIAYAGKEVKQWVDRQGIAYENILVSSFDADTKVHELYFSYLTETYFNHPNRMRSSYQPLPLFNNNVWDAPAFARVVSYSTTFWMMSEQIRPERLFTFSSHSMPFQALVDVGFWQNDIVTEDSRICLQCFQHYDGDYEVTPMYIPVSMDVVLGKSIWETMKSQYVQQRRWAYGVENFPYMAWNFFPNKRMPLAKKLRYMWNQTEGVYSWATAPILILILGRLPLWLLNSAERQTALALNTPYILEILMRVSLIGIIVAAFLGSTLLPKRPQDVPARRIVYMILQWPLLIVSMIVFGAIPAADAQTRLMLGKYLGFDVTKKFRKRKEAM